MELHDKMGGQAWYCENYYSCGEMMKTKQQEEKQ